MSVYTEARARAATLANDLEIMSSDPVLLGTSAPATVARVVSDAAKTLRHLSDDPALHIADALERIANSLELFIRPPKDERVHRLSDVVEALESIARSVPDGSGT